MGHKEILLPRIYKDTQDIRIGKFNGNALNLPGEYTLLNGKYISIADPTHEISRRGDVDFLSEKRVNEIPKNDLDNPKMLYFGVTDKHGNAHSATYISILSNGAPRAKEFGIFVVGEEEIPGQIYVYGNAEEFNLRYVNSKIGSIL